MSRKLKVIAGVYAVVAIALLMVVGTMYPDYFNKATAYLAIPVINGMCVWGIGTIKADIDELRFGLLYRNTLKGDFSRLIQAACLYATNHSEHFRYGKLKIAMSSLLPSFFGASAYIIVFIGLGGSFNPLIALAIATVLLPFGWFDTIVSNGILQLEEDEAFQPVKWY